MKPTSGFATLLQRFFTERLVQQRQASPHTICSYRDTFRLLLQFILKRLHKTASRVAFEDIDAPFSESPAHAGFGQSESVVRTRQT
jgi:hypothetical protein